MDPPPSETTRAASNPVAAATSSSHLDTPRSLSTATSQRSIKDLVNRFNQQSTKDQHVPRPAQRSRLQRPPRSPAQSRRAPSPQARSATPQDTISPLKSPTRRSKIRTPASLSAEQLRTRRHDPHDPAHDSFFSLATRRGSDGSLSSSSAQSSNLHKRARSNVEYDLPAPLHSSRSRPSTNHRRARSDFVGPESNSALSIQTVSYNSLPRHSSASLISPSRIPVSSARRTSSFEPLSPTTSRHISQMGQSINHFPAPASPRSRHTSSQRTPSFGSTSSALTALGNTRPPVSAATTAASRARSGQRFESSLASQSTDSARLRKKKIPELDNINLAARKEKIQRAFSDHSAEAPGRSSLSGGESRRGSNFNDTASDGRGDHNGNEQEMDSSFEHTDTEYTDTEQNEAGHADTDRLEASGPLSPITPRNIPGAFVDYDESPLPDNQDMTTSTVYPGPSSSPPKEGAHEAIYEAEEDDEAVVESCDEISVEENVLEETAPGTLLDQVMKMRERSLSSASHTDFEEGSSFAPSENGDRASIHIMLQDDGETERKKAEDWSSDLPSSPALYHASGHAESSSSSQPAPETYRIPDSDEDSFASDAAQVGLSSPWFGQLPHLEEFEPETPKKSDFTRNVGAASLIPDEDKTPRQSKRAGRASALAIIPDWTGNGLAREAINRIADQYQEVGSVSPEMLHDFQQNVAPNSPAMSKAEANDPKSVAFLLDTILREKAGSPQPRRTSGEFLTPGTYNPGDRRNMETPEGDDTGTAIVYSTTYRRSGASLPRASQDATNDFSYMQAFSPSSIMVNTPASYYDLGTPASEYSGTNTPALFDTAPGAADEDDDYRPPPPPKDYGYSPRSSTGQLSIRSSSQTMPSSRNSRSSDRLRLPEIPMGTGLGLTMSNSSEDTTRLPPPLPQHSPPPPPFAARSELPFEVVLTDASPGPTFTSNPTSPVSTRSRTLEERHRNFSTPARPSMESMKPEMVPLPPSQSMSSFQSSSVRPSVDYGPPPAVMPPSPNPETERLTKRRHIVQEVIDTEYSYHQDMKIILDIYKATVSMIISAEDRKTLFGNVDRVEEFSLEFYDALRKAAAPIYVPPKSSRWQPKRGSFSTSNSDGNSSGLIIDDDKDRMTTIGAVFSKHMSRMEHVYEVYLKNHENANNCLQRIQADPTVQCWLTECQSQASDITGAWNLDSLLVKPTQRILKYGLLLGDLVSRTPENHPDRLALQVSLAGILAVCKRINDSKKRSEYVQEVHRKRAKSNARNALAVFLAKKDTVKDRVGAEETHKDPEFDQAVQALNGHYLKLQICMRDIQHTMEELEKPVAHFMRFAEALQNYIECEPNNCPEIESKFRKFILAINELGTAALPDHKNRIQKHVVQPMLDCLKLYAGPQHLIAKRKKRVADYARLQAMQQKGQKPDAKTVDGAEVYEALNEQLKLDLPRLYALQSELVRACLNTHVYLQTQWWWLWKEKLAPVVDFAYAQYGDIEPDFAGEYEFVHSQLLSLGVCNGSALADIANFLSPQTTLVGDETISSQASTRRPSILPNGHRTMSIGSENQPLFTPSDFNKSFNSALASPVLPDSGQPGYYGRMRSSSSLSARGRAPSTGASQNSSLPPSRMPSVVQKASFSSHRPSTAQRPADLKSMSSRISLDTPKRSPSIRPGSAVSSQQQQQEPRFSGMFSSAMPMSDVPISPGPLSPQHAPLDTPVMFVAASLFEFNIDRARREAGYPYLTYVEGEVFDVVAQKGELWLAKNQDDPTYSLGWIWEQHFVILSQES
ncbi:hypothetical protein E4T38_05710 [Aureobasidium subglaciale]|nr:hypothetical protein E4T38_05710 [Aureobasidium subglaciale]KAI5221096.1 hypothetical protein E4T40_05652 [Aureobasidium subglaciale]KAI5224320.1 hypothetical protein E4T41_05689 [Aureobasidium subglaciale]KAI5261034.1 hypothetical protein E4T46_05464 [Aureobasidium subglaciale]